MFLHEQVLNRIADALEEQARELKRIRELLEAANYPVAFAIEVTPL